MYRVAYAGKCGSQLEAALNGPTELGRQGGAVTPVNYVLADEILDRFFSLLFQVFVDLFNNIKTGFVFSRKLFLVVDMLLEVSQEKKQLEDISDWDQFYQSCGHAYKKSQPMLAREGEREVKSSCSRIYRLHLQASSSSGLICLVHNGCFWKFLSKRYLLHISIAGTKE